LGFPFRFDEASSHEQGRIRQHRSQQIAERPAGVAAERVVLALHGRDIVDLELTGGEVVVPEQGKPLRERVRGQEHAINPPGLKPVGVAGAGCRIAEQIRGRRELGGNPLGAARTSQNAIHSSFGPIVQIALQFVPGRGEAGPAAERPDSGEVPWSARAGAIRRPWG
jgi:hypothetical protein